MNEFERSENNPVLVKRVVKARVENLQQGYLSNNGTAVANLAKLRGGVAKPIGQDFSLVALTVSDLYQKDDPIYRDPSFAEEAAYAAITLYAVHQQSRQMPMHQNGTSFGQAIGLLHRKLQKDGAVQRRFEFLATAPRLEALLHYARALIRQLRSNELPLDYAKFAEDLYWLQAGEAPASRVRRRWGLDFQTTIRGSDEPSSHDPVQP